MKKIIFLLPFLLLFLSGYSQQLEWFPFKWLEDKRVMYIPVTIDGLYGKFDMQFDLGAGITRLYGNSIEPFLKTNKSLREKLDTTNTFKHNEKDTQWLNNIHLKLENVSYNGINILYYKNYGQVYEINTSQTMRIGTIGADLFRGKVLVIDYKNTRMAVFDSLSVEYENLPHERFELDNINRIKLPFRINGKEEWLLFDTGASRQQLSTTKERALAISDSVVVDSELSSAWGDLLTVFQLKVNKPVEFAGKVLENLIVCYEKDARRLEQFYKINNIWGITGNAYFWDNVVIIDYKNKTFRVK